MVSLEKAECRNHLQSCNEVKTDGPLVFFNPKGAHNDNGEVRIE